MTNGVWVSGGQHANYYSNADGSFGLLRRASTHTQARTDQGVKCAQSLLRRKKNILVNVVWRHWS